MNLEENKLHRHISWSQYRIWKECQHLHWLQYHDNLKLFEPSKYMDFGSSVHYTAEDVFKLQLEGKDLDFDPQYRFVEHMNETIGQNHQSYSPQWAITPEELDTMLHSGKECVLELIDFIRLDPEFKGWEVYAVEQDIDLPISDDMPEWRFKGFIDLVLKKDNKYYLLDYKTCSWGWGKDKTQNPLYMGQIHAYKHYFMKMHPEIESTRDVKLGFVLVKRTGKKGSRIQLLKTSAGEKTLGHIEDELKTMARTFQKEIHMKTGRMNNACDNCSFFNTEHCPLGGRT